MTQFNLTPELYKATKGRPIVHVTYNNDVLKECIRWLNELHPDYKFKVIQATFDDDPTGWVMCIRTVTVESNGVRLGRLVGMYSGRSRGYAVEVEQCVNGRWSNGITSNLLPKLKTHMKRVFAPPELSTISADAFRTVRVHLNDHAVRLRRMLTTEENRLEGPMREFIRANADAFVAFVGDPAKTNAWLKGLAARDEHANTTHMYDDLCNLRMTSVSELADGSFVVGGKAYRSFDDVPEQYKEALGMFKLSSDDLILDGFGARCGTHYAIYARQS